MSPELLPPLSHLADWHDRLARYAFAAQLVEGRRVLDLACGSGDGAALLAEAGAREVVAVDPRAALIAEAQRRLGHERVRFVARHLDAQLRFESVEAAPQSAAEAFDAQATSVRLPAVGPRSAASEGEAGQAAPDEAEPDASPGEVGADGGFDEPFDVILALDPHLPLGERDFLEALSRRLSPGGCAVVAVRLDDASTLRDVLMTLERGREAGEPTAPGLEAVREHFSAVFGAVQEISSRSTLLTSLLPPTPEGWDGRFATRRWPESGAGGGSAHAALFVLMREGEVDLSPLTVPLALDALVERLDAGVRSLLQRASSFEHRGQHFEEQLTQKDALIDDLEREVRATDARRREVELQLSRLREELDGLQGELIAPQSAAGSEVGELQRGLEARDVQLSRLGEQLEHSEALVVRLRESVEVQRLTIDALRTQLQLSPLPVSQDEAPALAATSLAEADGEALRAARERVSALQAELEARDAEIARLSEALRGAEAQRSEQARVERELRQALERSQAELREARRERDALRETTRGETAALQRRHEDDQARTAQLGAELGELKAKLAELQSTATQHEQEVAALEQSRRRLEAQLARFRRGRRTKRGRASEAGSPVVAPGGERLDEALDEIASRDRRLAELEAELGRLRHQSAAASAAPVVSEAPSSADAPVVSEARADASPAPVPEAHAAAIERIEGQEDESAPGSESEPAAGAEPDSRIVEGESDGSS